MKTNQLMRIEIGNFRLPVEHKTGMGSLTELWAYGNGLRIAKGKTALDLRNYLRERSTLEFAEVVERRVFGKCVESTHFETLGTTDSSKPVEPTHLDLVEVSSGRFKLSGPLQCLRTKRGKNGGTWAHYYLLIDAAAHLDPEFKYEVYNAFVENKILQWRDQSGDEFKALNVAIDAYLTDRKDKDNKFVYVNAAKMMNKKLQPPEGNWNLATFEQLERRTEVEKKLISFMELGLVTTWTDLKDVIVKL